MPSETPKYLIVLIYLSGAVGRCSLSLMVKMMPLRFSGLILRLCLRKFRRAFRGEAGECFGGGRCYGKLLDVISVEGVTDSVVC